MDKVQPNVTNNSVMFATNYSDCQTNENNVEFEEIIVENGESSTSRLTPEMILRAEMEVNEKDSWRIRDIEALREIIRGKIAKNFCRFF